MINKKTPLIVSGFLSGGLLFWSYVGNYYICDLFARGGSSSSCPFILTNIGINLLPIIPVFLFSLITYFMSDEIYRAWLRFSYVWIPLSMVLIFLAPEYSADWVYPVVKGTVAFSASLLFVILSLVLIIWKYFAARRFLN